MKCLKNSVVIKIFLVLSFLLITGCGNTNDATGTNKDSEQSKYDNGEKLRIALNAQPPSLDPLGSTATATRDTARLVFESLLVLNTSFEPVPFLAEKVENVDNQTFTFHLRQGVLFHNGEEMKAEDVVASMNRWIESNNFAKKIIGNAEFEEQDEYTVTLELSAPSSLALTVMAVPGQFAAIMPKEISEEAGPDGITEYVGTGPYEFVDWQQDNYIHFTKFDDYIPLEDEADGLAGKREALVEDVYFYISEDPSTRLAGVQSGEYDIAYQLPFDSYQQLLSMNLQVLPQLAGDMVLQYNAREGVLSDPKMRHAINMAFNIDEILQASLVEPELYQSDASLMESGNTQWATNVGEENYNVNNPEKAKKLLEEAGYDGEEITIVTTRDYQHYYDSSVVMKEQLENIGMNINLEVYDWPTLTEVVQDPATWHMRVNGFTFKADPTQILYLDSEYAGVVEDKQIDDLMEEILQAETSEQAKEVWEELQEYVWTESLPATKLGSYSALYALGENVEGFVYSPSSGAQFWNISVNN